MPAHSGRQDRPQTFHSVPAVALPVQARCAGPPSRCAPNPGERWRWVGASARRGPRRRGTARPVGVRRRLDSSPGLYRYRRRPFVALWPDGIADVDHISQRRPAIADARASARSRPPSRVPAASTARTAAGDAPRPDARPVRPVSTSVSQCRQITPQVLSRWRSWLSWRWCPERTCCPERSHGARPVVVLRGSVSTVRAMGRRPRT